MKICRKLYTSAAFILENSRQNALDSRKEAGQIEIGREEKTPAPFKKRKPVVQQCAVTLQTALSQVGQELILLRCKELKKNTSNIICLGDNQ